MIKMSGKELFYSISSISEEEFAENETLRTARFQIIELVNNTDIKLTNDEIDEIMEYLKPFFTDSITGLVGSR